MQPIQLLLLNAMHIVNLLYNTVMLENATRLVLQVVISITQMLIARLATRYVKHALELPLTAPPVIPPISSIKPASHNALLITSQRIKPVWSVTTQYQLALNLSPSIQQPELKTIKVWSTCSSTKMSKSKAILLLSSLLTLKWIVDFKAIQLWWIMVSHILKP